MAYRAFLMNEKDGIFASTEAYDGTLWFMDSVRNQLSLMGDSDTLVIKQGEEADLMAMKTPADLLK